VGEGAEFGILSGISIFSIVSNNNSQTVGVDQRISWVDIERLHLTLASPCEVSVIHRLVMPAPKEAEPRRMYVCLSVCLCV